MSTYRIDATLTKDGTVTLNNLPFHAGDSIEIIIVSRSTEPEHIELHSLAGQVIHYENPTEPVGQEDWDVLK